MGMGRGHKIEDSIDSVTYSGRGHGSCKVGEEVGAGFRGTLSFVRQDYRIAGCRVWDLGFHAGCT